MKKRLYTGLKMQMIKSFASVLGIQSSRLLSGWSRVMKRMMAIVLIRVKIFLLKNNNVIKGTYYIKLFGDIVLKRSISCSLDQNSAHFRFTTR